MGYDLENCSIFEKGIKKVPLSRKTGYTAKGWGKTWWTNVEE